MLRNILILLMSSLFFAFGAAATDTWCPHVTAVAGWKTEIALYTSGGSPVSYQIEKFDAAGNPLGVLSGLAAGKTWTVVANTSLAYEGTARITSSADLLVKAVYQAGESPSVCEFYLTGAVGAGWVLPNSLRAWLDYVGLALVNPSGASVTLTLEAWKNGVKAAPDTVVSVPAKSKYVMLSNGIWGGVNYADLDTIVVHSSAPIPAPISITGNLAGDRHLFFSAQPEPAAGALAAGDLAAVDAIVGNLRYVPVGTFVQGAPEGEPCRDFTNDIQFTHTLTLAQVVMETEVNRTMWAALKAVRPTLPNDPTNLARGSGMTNPVQQATWFEAVLFANLLSLQSGQTPCYFIDAAFTTPIDATNYQTGPWFCNWNADGFRLPSEGEWEHFCRAGTTTPFWVATPGFDGSLCIPCDPAPVLANFSDAAWWCANALGYCTYPVGAKAANPWNLRDVHGNAGEWCWDVYVSPYPTGTVTDYRGGAGAGNRVCRGGGFNDNPVGCLSAHRCNVPPDTRIFSLGFRLVRTWP